MVSLGIIALLFGAIYTVYFSLVDATTNVGLRTAAAEALSRQIEIIRNLPYEQVGIQNGSPAGTIPAQQTIKVGDQAFLITTEVRSVDDPFDGTIGGTPNDTAPADYKLVELKISCSTCAKFNPLTLTSTVAPKSLESSSSSGSLFVNVFDASGAPVVGATVQVINTSTSPSINLTDTTNASGLLQLVGIPTSTQSYQITVSKSGYSTDKTYPVGAPSNPNPLKSYATVANGAVTNASFAIDRVSTLNAKTSDALCAPLGNTSFSISGAKLIGTNPNVLKFSTSSITNASGSQTFSTMEWDNYTLSLTAPSYLLGTIPLSPLNIAPNTATDFRFVAVSSNPNALMVTATDAVNGAGVPNTTVTLTKPGFSQTFLAGRAIKINTDWSGGQYSDASSIDVNSIPGSFTLLANASSTYSTSTNAWLVSKTIDVGSSATSYFSLSWNPERQNPQTLVQFQLAANNDNATWNFVGPDGTANSFYTSSSTISGLDNNRYLRYKAYLSTQNEMLTPEVDDVSVSFSSVCVPLYQTLFTGLDTGTYTLTISAPQYTSTNSSVSVGAGWQESRISMTHQ